MKHLFYLITIAFFLPSCASTYYFSTLDTTSDNIVKGDNGDFITGNDSIMIAYSFNGEKAPILLMIQNDGSKPLYIDWQRSSIIFNEDAMNNYNTNKKTQRTKKRSSAENINSSLSSREFRMNTSMFEGVSFIAPHSRVEYENIKLGNMGLDNIPNKEYRKTSFVKKDKTVASIKRTDFTVEDTPFKFRIYLTLYTDPNQPFAFDNQFFISNLMKSKKLTPSNMDQELMDRGDLFYIKKESNNKDVGSILLKSGIVMGLAVLDVVLTPNDCDY